VKEEDAAVEAEGRRTRGGEWGFGIMTCEVKYKKLVGVYGWFDD
jgi:hypothetical protein